MLALKTTDADPDEIVTLAGTETDGFALETATVTEDTAGWLRDNEQLAVPLLPNIDGVHVSDPREIGPESVRLKLCVLPL